ncbi:MAG: vanadium-dependent haloperoxidase [Pseudomonadota bacterium]
MDHNKSKTNDASRRRFLQGAAGLSALGATGAIGAAPLPGRVRRQRNDALGTPADGAIERAAAVADLKIQAAQAQEQATLALPPQPRNDDETRYAGEGFYGSFYKSLPQNEFGEVDARAFKRLQVAMATGAERDFSRLVLAPTANRPLANPQGAFAVQFAGLDSHATRMPAAPAFASATTAAEMGEVYWQGLTRDVPFLHYDADPSIANAVADVNRFSATVGPKVAGSVTPRTLFRGETPGDLNGPFISQFLLKDIPYGPSVIEQRYGVPQAGADFMTDTASCVGVQRGEFPGVEMSFDAEPRYIYNNRALGEYVHTDVLFQAYFNAALILLSLGPQALDQNHPYRGISTQGPFTSFGGPFVLQMLTYVSNLSLNGAWYQKWRVHRRLRPEAYGLRVDNVLAGRRSYEVHPDILNAEALQVTQARHGTALLPMAYPEGSPCHPAYPAGHATIAGACVTVLKAFFDESFILPDTVQADATGLSLVPYGESALTLGGELDKLANNVALGRDAAGVHYRSDGVYGLDVGEQQAITLLKEYAAASNEPFDGFRLTKFDGTTVTLGA